MNRRRAFEIRERVGLIASILGIWLVANLVIAFLVNLPRGNRAGNLGEAVGTFRQTRTKSALASL